jgi:hypothetical protein
MQKIMYCCECDYIRNATMDVIFIVNELYFNTYSSEGENERDDENEYMWLNETNFSEIHSSTSPVELSIHQNQT